jgi:hypothetical protein
MNRERFLLLLWAAVILQVAAWIWWPEAASKAALPQIAEENRGKAFSSNEDIFVDGRGRQREAVLRVLDQPWGSRCAGDGRKQFISGLNEYYYQRQNQIERYPENFGKLGADYIARQWASTDDQRIDRLTQDAYARGYLKPADFEALASKLIATVVRGERVTGNACAG